MVVSVRKACCSLKYCFTCEDLCETDLELPDRQLVVVAGRAVLWGHWPRQSLRPAIEERLDIRGTEGITGRLDGGGIGTRQEPVVQALEAEVIAAEALLDPLVPVETHLHRIGEIGADLEKRRSPRGVVHREVVVIDRDWLPREVEADLGTGSRL